VTNFAFDWNKQTLDNRRRGELLLRRAEKIKTRFVKNPHRRFAGFDCSSAPVSTPAELVLRGKNSYSTRVTDTALGTIRSLNHGGRLRTRHAVIGHQGSQRADPAKVGSPFEKEERYTSCSASRKLRRA